MNSLTKKLLSLAKENLDNNNVQVQIKQKVLERGQKKKINYSLHLRRTKSTVLKKK